MGGFGISGQSISGGTKKKKYVDPRANATKAVYEKHLADQARRKKVASSTVPSDPALRGGLGSTARQPSTATGLGGYSLTDIADMVGGSAGSAMRPSTAVGPSRLTNNQIADLVGGSAGSAMRNAPALGVSSPASSTIKNIFDILTLYARK